MADKQATVTLQYELNNAQAIAALKEIEAEHDRIALKIGKPISMGGVSGGGTAGQTWPGSGAGQQPYLPSWTPPGLARFAIGGSSGVGARMAENMNQGYLPPGSWHGPPPPPPPQPTSTHSTQTTQVAQAALNATAAAANSSEPSIAKLNAAIRKSASDSNRLADAKIAAARATGQYDTALRLLNSELAKATTGGARYYQLIKTEANTIKERDKQDNPLSSAVTRQLLRMTVAYAVYQVISEIPKAITSSINIAQRGDLTQNQRMRRGVEEVPLVGGLIGSLLRFKDAIDGTTERIRLVNERLRYSSIANQTQALVTTASGQLNQQLSGSQGRASALMALNPRLTDQSFDRSTFHGRIGYEESEARRRAQSELDVATARHQGALAEVSEAGTGVSEINTQIQGARAERDAAMARLNATGQLPGGNQSLPGQQAQSFIGGLGSIFGINGGDGGALGGFFGRGINQLAAGQGGIGGALIASPFMAAQGLSGAAESQAPRAEALAAVISANERLESLETERISRMQRMSAAMTAQGASEQQVGQARINMLQTELTLLQQREQRMTQGAQRLGMMNPVDRSIAMNAFRHMRDNGFENTPLFMREQAMQIAPNMVSAAATRAGENSAEFRELRAAGEFGTAPGARQQSIQEVREAISRLADSMSTSQLQTLQTSANLELGGIRMVLNSILVAIMNRGGVQQQQAWLQNQLQNVQGQHP